jgi:hypothetical protein
VAVLVNPANATITETTGSDVVPAARAIGLQIQVFNASTSRDSSSGLLDEPQYGNMVRYRPATAMKNAADLGLFPDVVIPNYCPPGIFRPAKHTRPERS